MAATKYPLSGRNITLHDTISLLDKALNLRSPRPAINDFNTIPPY